MNTQAIFDLLDQAKKIHFIGIGGISMYGAAMFAVHRGYAVTGSDRAESEHTAKLREAGVRVYLTHDAHNAEGADAIVYTAAVDESNPEMAYAVANGIPTVSRAQFLGYIMRGYHNRIGVSGTHGKSTTSAMLTHIFLAAGRDPSAALGAELSEIGGAYRIGSDEDFIFESCEYKDSFLSFSPDIAIILNIDHDHVDYFRTMDQMVQSFAKSIESAHTVIVPAGDQRVEQALRDYKGKIVRIGMTQDCDYHPFSLIYTGGLARFLFTAQGEPLSMVFLNVPGEHNLMNALAAAAAAHISGIDPSTIAKGLANFHGAHRRLEQKGNRNGMDVYDDYAHHPTEIRATLSAVKALGYRRVRCVFQPHTYSRTAELFDDFTRAFGDADEVIFADIYPAREVNSFGVSSADLARAVPGARYFDSFEKIADYLCTTGHAGDVILTMGAGDIDRVADLLLKDNT